MVPLDDNYGGRLGLLGLEVIIVKKVIFIFGLVAFFLLSPSFSGPVVAQAKSESTDCARWLKLIDPSCR